MSDEAVSEGWARPANARKFHYYIGGRSLCGKWFFLGVVDEDSGESTSADCKPCAKIMVTRRKTLHKAEKSEGETS